MTRDEVLDLIADVAARAGESLEKNAQLPDNADSFAGPSYIAACFSHMSLVADEMREAKAIAPISQIDVGQAAREYAVATGVPTAMIASGDVIPE